MLGQPTTPIADNYNSGDTLVTYPIYSHNTIRHVVVVMHEGEKAVSVNGHILEWESFFELNHIIRKI